MISCVPERGSIIITGERQEGGLMESPCCLSGFFAVLSFKQVDRFLRNLLQALCHYRSSQRLIIYLISYSNTTEARTYEVEDSSATSSTDLK